MIRVHHLDRSRSQRVLWLLEELGWPYDVVPYRRNPQTLRAPASLRAVHPLGKAPVITDGDIVVAESGAIIEYLLDAEPKDTLRPPVGTPQRLQYRYWLHFAEGSAMPPLLLKLVFDRIEKAPMPFFVRPFARNIAQNVKNRFIVPQLAEQLDFMEQTLQSQAWFAGDAFSAADIQMSFPLEAAAARGGLDMRYPALERFLAAIHERPAYQRALERGGPFDIPG